MPVAWQVDPALALSLSDHFPASSDVKQALEQLVVEHAHAAKVRTQYTHVCVATCCPATKLKSAARGGVRCVERERVCVCGAVVFVVVVVLLLQVQMLPKAALLLSTAPSSEKRDRMMRYLPVWAPGTGTHTERPAD